jgi:RNA polymerase sigma-70 factor, ECF subfamily
MNESALRPRAGADDFARRLGELRPKLHRYCARMTGSVIDGEDVLQEALLKALEVIAEGMAVANLEGWLFRIVHNAALDFLRRRAREAGHSSEEVDMIADSVDSAENRDIAAASLRTFMRLPVAQRSSVILMDVLGYSQEEISELTASTVPAVKAALHRGRARLREIAREPENLPHPAMAEAERRRLGAYVERFNARDFDAIRNMLTDEVRLDLVARTQKRGRSEVGTYFHNYSSVDDWQLVPGFVDRRPALLVYDPRDPPGPPRYFILLEWAGDAVARIRDFRHARYAVDGADLQPLA